MSQAMPDNPFLKGIYEPIQMECDAPDLIVEGEVPLELDGTFYRNGPNPHYAPRGEHHLFGGDGMTHAFHINSGRVGYTNRWIRTAKFNLEASLGRSVINPMNPFECEEGYFEFVLNDKEGLANTACVWHGGRLLILEEGHRPFEVDPVTLASIGSYDFDGQLNTAMTAHPKVDPVTGEMVFFAYMSQGPFASDVALYSADATGRMTWSQIVETPYPAMVHDFVVTQNYILIPVFPLTGSMDRAMQGQSPFAWEPDRGTHLGVIPRGGSADDVRWIECENQFVFHWMNGYDDNGVITTHQCQFEHAPLFPRVDGEVTSDATPVLSRWTIDLNAESPRLDQAFIDDGESEFPQIDPRFATRAYRYGFFATQGSGVTGASGMYNAVGRYDHATGNVVRYALGDPDSTATSEPIFVPRSADAAEGDGFLLAVATDLDVNRSRLVILDAQHIEAGPLATAKLDHRVPAGFHGGFRRND